MAVATLKPRTAVRGRFWIDEVYDASVLRLTRWTSNAISRLESSFFASFSGMIGLITVAMGWFSRLFDNFVIDPGFDRFCGALSQAARTGSKTQSGQIQSYLRTIALALTVLVLILVWGWKST